MTAESLFHSCVTHTTQTHRSPDADQALSASGSGLINGSVILMQVIFSKGLP